MSFISVFYHGMFSPSLFLESNDYNAKVSYMRDLVKSLPLPNHDTMKLLFGHLHRYIRPFYNVPCDLVTKCVVSVC